MAKCLMPVVALPFLLLLLFTLCMAKNDSKLGNLENDFYKHSCPSAEGLITSAITSAINNDNTNAPGLLRMHFHDCFVDGCDGSVLIDSPSEKDAPPNLSLHGFEAIDSAKSAVEGACPGIVSCADILALAAQISANKASGGGISWKVLTGRRDGLTSSPTAPNTFLPSPNANISTLIQQFSAVGLSTEEMVDLSGAHSIGKAHCFSFADRLSGTQNPPIDLSYQSSLSNTCTADFNSAVNLDVTTPVTLDGVYYKNLQVNKGLMMSDAVLQSDPRTKGRVAKNVNPQTFKKNFRSAMLAMGNIGVLTGSQGQIRLNCRKMN